MLLYKNPKFIYGNLILKNGIFMVRFVYSSSCYTEILTRADWLFNKDGYIFIIEIEIYKHKYIYIYFKKKKKKKKKKL